MVPLETISYSTKVLILGWAQMIDLEGHLGPQKDYLLTVGNFSTLMKLFLKRLCALLSGCVEMELEQGWKPLPLSSLLLEGARQAVGENCHQSPL